jgi:hypothetical protein
METRIQQVKEAYRVGDIPRAMALAQSIGQVPDYDWPVLLALIGKLDAIDDPGTVGLYSALDRLTSAGPRRIPLAGPGVRMPVPD